MAKPGTKQFEKKLTVRSLVASDFDGIVELGQLCFPNMAPWTRDQFQSQITVFPEGQIGVEYQGKLVASSSSVILDFEMYKDWHSWSEISDDGFIRNHKPTGTTLYGIEIMVHPKFRGYKLARRLYDARKKIARERNLMRVVVGGRMPGYGEHAGTLSPREYIEKVVNKSIFDSVLTTQLSNGFILKRIIPQYLGEDGDSKGYATFLEWTNLDYLPDPKQRFVPIIPARVCAVQYQMRAISNFEEFARQCEYFVDVASEYKCDFILFPEMITTQLLSFIGPEKDAAAAMRKISEFTPQYVELFHKLALKGNVNIVGGSHFTMENEMLYNVSYLFRRDGTVGKQYKIHITPTERQWWGIKGGSSVEVFDTDRGKIAIQVCYDVEFPELSRVAVERGAQIIFVPFCTDERYAYLRVRYCSQARCIENHVYVVMAGSVGNLPQVEGTGIHYAQSAIFTPSDIPFPRDAVAGECTPNIETVIFEDLDLELLKRHKQSGTVLNWKDQRKDLYEITHRLTPPGDV